MVDRLIERPERRCWARAAATVSDSTPIDEQKESW
jgi:hypothetical protein